MSPPGLKPRHTRRKDGFTTIELVLVVAATFVVVALGASMYRTYLVRAQIGASVAGASATQRLVVAAFKHNGSPPLDAGATGIDDPVRRLLTGAYVGSFEVHNGRIDLRFSANAHVEIAGKILSLTPFETTELDVVWVCGNATPSVGLKPLGFASGALQAKQVPTPIADRYLPASCR